MREINKKVKYKIMVPGLAITAFFFNIGGSFIVKV